MKWDCCSASSPLKHVYAYCVPIWSHMFYVWKMCQHLIAPKITQKCRQMYQFLASSFRIYARPFFAHSVACLSWTFVNIVKGGRQRGTKPADFAACVYGVSRELVFRKFWSWHCYKRFYTIKWFFWCIVRLFLVTCDFGTLIGHLYPNISDSTGFEP